MPMLLPLIVYVCYDTAPSKASSIFFCDDLQSFSTHRGHRLGECSE